MRCPLTQVMRIDAVLIEIDSRGNMADERCWTYKSLGMDRRIARRDFLNGIAVAIGSIGAGPAPAR